MTLLRERRAATVGSSNARAEALEEIQYVYAARPHAYDQAVIEAARQDVALPPRALRLAVRLTRHRDAGIGLQSAMALPASIDPAVGHVMGQNRRTQQEAFEILHAATATPSGGT